MGSIKMICSFKIFTFHTHFFLLELIPAVIMQKQGAPWYTSHQLMAGHWIWISARLVGLVVGFEPTPPERLEPKSSALDRTATLPLLLKQFLYIIKKTPLKMSQFFKKNDVWLIVSLAVSEIWYKIVTIYLPLQCFPLWKDAGFVGWPSQPVHSVLMKMCHTLGVLCFN